MQIVNYIAKGVLIAVLVFVAWSIGHGKDVARAHREGRICGTMVC